MMALLPFAEHVTGQLRRWLGVVLGKKGMASASVLPVHCAIASRVSTVLG
jgi:hypothetical protein